MQTSNRKSRGAVFIAFFTLCLAMAVWAGATAGAQADNFTASVVTVKNKTGACEQDRAVTFQLTDSTNTSPPLQLTADESGKNGFTVSAAVPEGEYTLTIAKKGYLTYTMTGVTVYSDSRIELPKIELLAGDVDGNDNIDLNDLILSVRGMDFLPDFEALRKLGDVNEDGITNILDYTYTKSNFDKNAADDATAVYSEEYDKRGQPDTRQYGDAVYRIDDITFRESGWDYENFHQINNMTGAFPAALTDVLPSSGLRYKRDITPQDAGLLTFEINFGASFIQTQNSNFYFSFTDSNDMELVRIQAIDGTYHIISDLADTDTYSYATRIKAVMDLDNHTIQLYTDGSDAGEYPIRQDVSEVSRLYIGTTDEGILNLSPQLVQLYSNYLVNETLISSSKLPDDWEFTNGIAVATIDSNGGLDDRSFKINGIAGNQYTATKRFEPVSGKVVFESYILLPKKADGASVSLMSGDSAVVTVETKDGAFYTGETKLRDYRGNIWQCIRIEADTDTSTAMIRINGKKVGEGIPFAVSADRFDQIAIQFSPAQNAVMWFDDIDVHVVNEYADYVPAPVAAASDDYYIGLNVCNLWRNGHHQGWDSISPFDDLTPYLGYYDEGLPEVADWEIKWMAEHGIDYQHVCWYCPSGNIKVPIKKSRMNDALHDGYFNAEYSDMVKFNFMWENSGVNVYSLDQFKEYLWPYWVEYYFTDPRFMTIENQPVFTVWSLNNFITAFGGEDGAKAAIQFMKEDIKNYNNGGENFDGLLLWFADGHNMGADFFAKVERIGADGTYGYHWNKTGSDPDHQIYRFTTQRGFGTAHIVPTVSVGFNNVGWAGTRSDLIPLAGHKKVMEYIKNEFLPGYSNETEDWKSKALMVSTWNEFGEGTYVMPSNVHGFGYMDNVRQEFTNAGAHEDARPTANQLSRINILYPASRTPIRRLGYDMQEDAIIPEGVEKSWSGSDLSNWNQLFSINNFKVSNGVLSGTAKNNDPALKLVSGISVDTADAQYFHLRMKTSAATGFEVFFATSQITTFGEDLKFSTTVTKPNEYIDYYVRLDQNSKWGGMITDIRLDPVTTAGVKFEITNIDLMYIEDSQKPYSVVVNTVPLEFDFDPKIDGESNALCVACNPAYGIFSGLNLYHEWNRFTNELTLKNEAGDVLVMTVGRKMADKNGAGIPMPCAMTLRDGLPVIPLEFMLDQLGIPYTKGTNSIEIVSIPQEYIDVIQNRKPYEYEFNIPGDMEGFKPGNMSAYVDDTGCLYGVGGSTDPMLSREVSIDASAYNQLVVRMKSSVITQKPNEVIVLYFGSSSGDLSESKTFRMKLSDGTPDGDGFYLYTLDLTAQKNSSWKGTIQHIRVDPFNQKASFIIDYIRFLKK